MKKPTVADCLDEIRRLRAENDRLNALVKTQRPELAALRRLESGVRHCFNNIPRQLEHLMIEAQSLTGTTDDIPSVGELSGCWSTGRDRVYAELDKAAEKEPGPPGRRQEPQP